jgi:hypothetical protein
MAFTATIKINGFDVAQKLKSLLTRKTRLQLDAPNYVGYTYRSIVSQVPAITPLEKKKFHRILANGRLQCEEI